MHLLLSDTQVVVQLASTMPTPVQSAFHDQHTSNHRHLGGQAFQSNGTPQSIEARRGPIQVNAGGLILGLLDAADVAAALDAKGFQVLETAEFFSA